MKKIARKLLICSVFILLTVGCQPSAATVSTTTPQPTLVVTKVVLEAGEASPTPSACTPLLDGMELMVEPVSSDSAKVQLKGFEPGESLTLLFIAQPTATQSSEIEITPPNVVEPDGSFTYQERGLSILLDAKKNIWTVKVIHARGVACQEFILL